MQIATAFSFQTLFSHGSPNTGCTVTAHARKAGRTQSHAGLRTCNTIFIDTVCGLLGGFQKSFRSLTISPSSTITLSCLLFLSNLFLALDDGALSWTPRSLPFSLPFLSGASLKSSPLNVPEDSIHSGCSAVHSKAVSSPVPQYTLPVNDPLSAGPGASPFGCRVQPMLSSM